MSWFSSPFPGLASPAWGLAIVLALFLAALGATWRARIPGGITHRERRAHDPRWRGPARLCGLLLLAAPWLAAACASLFVIPVRFPQTVVLVSRSRLPASHNGTDPWQQGLAELRRRVGGGRLRDAGAVAGEVLERLRMNSPPGGWRAGNPETDRRVEEALRQILAHQDLAPPRLDAESLTLPPAVDSIPRWLVESVETSVLRAVTRRYNVERVSALVSDRKSGVGWAWGGVEIFLEAASDGGRSGTDVELIPVEEHQPVLLQGVLRARQATRRCPSGLEVELAVATASICQLLPSPCPAEATGTTSLELSLYQGSRRLGTVTDLGIPLARDAQLLRRTLPCFPLAEPVPDLAQLDLRTGAPVQIVPVAAADPAHPVGGPLRKVLVLADSAKERADWKRTTQLLEGLDPAWASEAVAAWQERMDDLGFNLLGRRGGERLSFSVGSCGKRRRHDEDVILNACSGRGLWIYPSSFDPGELPAVEPLPAIEEDRVLRARLTRRGLPGSDSWEGLPLVRGDLWRPADPRFLALAEAQPLSADLLSGSFPAADLALPFVTRRDDWATQDRLSVVTHLGFDAAEQSLLLPDSSRSIPQTFEPERFFVSWTQIVEALYAAAVDTGAPWASTAVPGAHDHPRCYLNGSDLARIAGRGLWYPFVFLALGLLLHVATVSLGLRALPPRTGRVEKRTLGRSEQPAEG